MAPPLPGPDTLPSARLLAKKQSATWRTLWAQIAPPAVNPPDGTVLFNARAVLFENVQFMTQPVAPFSKSKAPPNPPPARSRPLPPTTLLSVKRQFVNAAEPPAI